MADELILGKKNTFSLFAEKKRNFSDLGEWMTNDLIRVKKNTLPLCPRKIFTFRENFKKNVRESPKKDLKSVSRTLLIFT